METLRFIRVLIELEQIFHNGDMKIRITVDGKDGKVYEEQQFIEYSHFKSLGEEAFDRCVRQVRLKMGWREDGMAKNIHSRKPKPNKKVVKPKKGHPWGCWKVRRKNAVK